MADVLPHNKFNTPMAAAKKENVSKKLENPQQKRVNLVI